MKRGHLDIIVATLSDLLIFGGCDVTKAHTFACTSITQNYHSFKHRDISYVFNNEKVDNIFEYEIENKIQLDCYTAPFRN